MTMTRGSADQRLWTALSPWIEMAGRSGDRSEAEVLKFGKMFEGGQSGRPKPEISTYVAESWKFCQ